MCETKLEWDTNMKNDLRVTASEGVNWTKMAEDGWEAVALTGRKFRCPQKVTHFWTVPVIMASLCFDFVSKPISNLIRITGVLDFFHHPGLKNLNTTFRH
jgi:hypothetical protein